MNKMTMKQLVKELDRHSFGVPNGRDALAKTMTEVIERLNRRELTYTSDRLLQTRSTLQASIYTYNDYPEMMSKYELELTIDYSSLHRDEHEDFENSFFPRLPAGWMVTRREGDPACCSMSFYITRNRDWVFHQGR